MQTFNIGDKIQITVEDKTYVGIIMPSQDDNVLMLKLDSGYNMGTKKEHIDDIKVIETYNPKEEVSSASASRDPNKKNIMILHTGGTIASKVDYATGGVVSRFTAEEIIGLFPELKNIANISSKLISNMASDDMRFAHYNIIAQSIAEEASRVDGIILTQGTDTLHYTAAALSFMLENLNIPIIIVGSQRSSDRGSSDAGMNLICAAQFIVKSDFSGVAVCMHDSSEDDRCVIIHSVRARKMHSSRRDAFKSINTPPIATITYPDAQIDYLATQHFTRDTDSDTLEVKLFKENLKIGMLYIHPNMSVDEFRAYEHFDGLVILATGLGHCPISENDGHTAMHKNIRETIQQLARHMPVVITTQTIFGRVDMNVYGPGRELLGLGVLGNYCDMTPETAFIKLAYLLSHYEYEEISSLFGTNLRGEISPRSDSERSFL